PKKARDSALSTIMRYIVYQWGLGEVSEVMQVRHGSHARASSSPPARPGPVILSAAKDLCASRERPFPFAAPSLALRTRLRASAPALRVIRCDGSIRQGLFFKLELAMGTYKQSSCHGYLIVLLGISFALVGCSQAAPAANTRI